MGWASFCTIFDKLVWSLWWHCERWTEFETVFFIGSIPQKMEDLVAALI
jgi:hypothetical protein